MPSFAASQLYQPLDDFDDDDNFEGGGGGGGGHDGESAFASIDSIHPPSDNHSPTPSPLGTTSSNNQ